jgi:hypothetical protein
VTQLEVTPQNVKQPKNGRNSGHVRNSGDYGTYLVYSNKPRMVAQKKNCLPAEKNCNSGNEKGKLMCYFHERI